MLGTREFQIQNLDMCGVNQLDRILTTVHVPTIQDRQGIEWIIGQGRTQDAHNTYARVFRPHDDVRGQIVRARVHIDRITRLQVIGTEYRPERGHGVVGCGPGIEITARYRRVLIRRCIVEVVDVVVMTRLAHHKEVRRFSRDRCATHKRHTLHTDLTLQRGHRGIPGVFTDIRDIAGNRDNDFSATAQVHERNVHCVRDAQGTPTDFRSTMLAQLFSSAECQELQQGLGGA